MKFIPTQLLHAVMTFSLDTYTLTFGRTGAYVINRSTKRVRFFDASKFTLWTTNGRIVALSTTWEKVARDVAKRSNHSPYALPITNAVRLARRTGTLVHPDYPSEYAEMVTNANGHAFPIPVVR